MDSKNTLLVTGSTGQIGSELVTELRKKWGNDRVVAVFHNRPPSAKQISEGPCIKVDLFSEDDILNVLKKWNVTQVYHLAAILSAKGEKEPQEAWKVNMGTLYNILEAGRKVGLEKIFWPSSIAVFGPASPRWMTPQETVLNPISMYGVTKVAGELLCNYYYKKYGLDVRSVRFPGIISSDTMPGGGTTDFAVEIFYEALLKERYTCFVRENTRLPMMYMPDCLKCILDIMNAPATNIKRHDAYNVSSMNFSAGELVAEIRHHLPRLEVDYVPDERQTIADSWPMSLDDSQARRDWGWNPDYDLSKMVSDMIQRLREKFTK